MVDAGEPGLVDAGLVPRVAGAQVIVNLLLLMWASFFASPIGQCEPVDGPRLEFTPAERAEVKRRNINAAVELGWGPIFVAYFDSVAERESTYNPSVRHRLGKKENGLGLHGLDDVHRKKWPGEWTELCTPEASLMVVSEIVWIAVEKYGAETIWDVQAVFAGRFECTPRGIEGKTCTGEQMDRTTSAICGRMSSRGFSCNTRFKARDMAPRVPLDQRARVAKELMR